MKKRRRRRQWEGHKTETKLFADDWHETRTVPRLQVKSNNIAQNTSVSKSIHQQLSESCILITSFYSFRNSTIQKWHEKTRLTSAKANKGFSSFEQTTLKQIQQVHTTCTCVQYFNLQLEQFINLIPMILQNLSDNE